jgi:hypothetical protein
MTTIQAVFFGITLALTPCVVALAFLFWREEIEIREEEKARTGDTYSSQLTP